MFMSEARAGELCPWCWASCGPSGERLLPILCWVGVILQGAKKAAENLGAISPASLA